MANKDKVSSRAKVSKAGSNRPRTASKVKAKGNRVKAKARVKGKVKVSNRARGKGKVRAKGKDNRSVRAAAAANAVGAARDSAVPRAVRPTAAGWINGAAISGCRLPQRCVRRWSRLCVKADARFRN